MMRLKCAVANCLKPGGNSLRTEMLLVLARGLCCVEFRRPGAFELIEGGLELFCCGRRIAFESFDFERVVFVSILLEVEKLAGTIELIVRVEDELADGFVGTLTRRVPRINPFA